MRNLFETKKQAVEFLNSLGLQNHSDGKKWSETGTYYTRHGEYARPDYMPRRYADGFAIRCEYFFYQGTYGAPSDGRMDDEDFTNVFFSMDQFQ